MRISGFLLLLLLLTTRLFAQQDHYDYIQLSTGYYNPETKITCFKDPFGNETTQYGRLVIENTSNKAVEITGVITVKTVCGNTASRNFRTHLNGLDRYSYSGWARKCNIDLNVTEETCKGNRIVSKTDKFIDGWLDRISDVTYTITTYKYMPPQY